MEGDLAAPAQRAPRSCSRARRAARTGRPRPRRCDSAVCRVSSPPSPSPPRALLGLPSPPDSGPPHPGPGWPGRRRSGAARRGSGRVRGGAAALRRAEALSPREGEALSASERAVRHSPCAPPPGSWAGGWPAEIGPDPGPGVRNPPKWDHELFVRREARVGCQGQTLSEGQPTKF
mgnify:CR=1 FL=1